MQLAITGATGDIDIWIAINQANAERMIEVLRQFGFDMPDLTPKIFLTPQNIVRMGYPPMRIEVATSISGVDFSECYAERVVDVIDGIKVNIISLERLKQNKQASGRYKDLNDLENLP